MCPAEWLFEIQRCDIALVERKTMRKRQKLLVGCGNEDNHTVHRWIAPIALEANTVSKVE